MVTGMVLQTYFSIVHARSAAFFARQAAHLERQQEAAYDAGRDSEILAYACGSIFSSIAFLEALANELFADATKADGGHLASLDPSLRARVAELGTTDRVGRAPLLKKFATLLRAAGKTPPSLGCAPGQNVKTSLQLRNGLVHYKAHWLDIGTANMVRPDNLLQSDLYTQIRRRFAPRSAGPSGGQSSDQWLGHGCAAWVLESAIQYADEVAAALGITPLHHHVREQLRTE
jgi:hypothetical protein